MLPQTALAPAKVNLFLHVGPLDTDGYHPLASLVAFADIGDRVTMEAADRLSLTVTGPYAGSLGEQGDNLIVRALRALGEPGLRVTLDKRLPIAAGLGGGSSDAGTALKLARDLLRLKMSDDALAKIAGVIGADGPMCLYGRAAWAEGRGDRLTFEPRLPSLAALLVNPGVPSPTGAVYRAYDAGPARVANRPVAPTDWSASGVIGWLVDQRNDLQGPAVKLEPLIGAALAAVAALSGVRLTRMSGSGATVFALFDDVAASVAAAETLRLTRPDWWIQPALLRGPGEPGRS